MLVGYAGKIINGKPTLTEMVELPENADIIIMIEMSEKDIVFPSNGNTNVFKVIKYSQEYRDDMLFCYLSAKDALGVIPRLRDDILDIQKYYFDKNEMFWIAVNDDNRVVGMIGTDTISETDMWLKRLFVKPEMKRNGIAGALLDTAVEYAKSKGITVIHTRFSDNYIEAFHFYTAKGFLESERSDGARHLIKSI